MLTRLIALFLGAKNQIFMSDIYQACMLGAGAMPIPEALVHDAGGAESRKSVNVLDQHNSSLKSSAAA